MVLDETNFCNGTVTPGTDGICLIYTEYGVVKPFPKKLSRKIIKGLSQ